MPSSKIFHCIVDDTALITNISEIETWVQRGAIALVVPLYTLERLHLLKKDTSQIGQNARKAVKFLDEATSNPDVKVLIQEPDDQYQTWTQVEAHYVEAQATTCEEKETVGIVGDTGEAQPTQQSKGDLALQNGTGRSDDSDKISQMVMNKLNVSKGATTSPLSTPPLSPSSSGPQSSKTSPEVKSATLLANDLSPVPPTLKGLINPVVWYTHEKMLVLKHIVFLTNSSDTAYLARDFGVVSKNIHQLRAAINLEEQEAKNHDRYKKKHTPNSPLKPPSEPRTLFRYEDEESEEEEVVFKPRGRGSTKGGSVKGGSNGRGNLTGSVRGKGHGHSPANSLSAPPPPVMQPKPQIPTEEIDPDSFDRGSFARGNTPLVSVGNYTSNNANGANRTPVTRGNHSNGGPSRGGFHRGSGRGSGRGRGRLFVP